MSVFLFSLSTLHYASSYAGISLALNLTPFSATSAFVDFPFRWNAPSTWPWFIYVWLAFFLANPAISLWRWLQRERAKSWPSASGRIDSAFIQQPRRFLGLTLQPSRSRSFVAVLDYSFSLSGSSHRGAHKRTFASEEEANEFLRGLSGLPVTVQYDPGRPEASTLLESTIDSLLANRSPEAETSGTMDWRNPLPAWLRPLLGVFALLSFVGLFLSLFVHLGALLGHLVVPESWFVFLHVGIFVVWFPAVFVLQRRIGYTRGAGVWKKAFKGSPDGLRYTVYFFFLYAVINFVSFLPQAPTGRNTGGTPPIVWRGFSGHWMAFYSAAFAILYAAWRSDPPRR